MQPDYYLVYRLGCCNKEAPNTVLKQGEVYCSLQNSPEVCSPGLVGSSEALDLQICLWFRELFRVSWSPTQ